MSTADLAVAVAGGCAAVAGTLFGVALHRSGARAAGPANLVTLVRAALGCALAGFVLRSLGEPDVRVAALAAVALALDAVDGHVARRTGTATPLGARFDVEVDAFLVAVLSVHVASLLGPWVLAVGAMRYAFVAASWLLPWLRAPLPRRLDRRLVGALQGVALAVAAAGVLPRAAATGVVAAALGALLWSFGRDVRLLAVSPGRTRGSGAATARRR